jgi:hypothetical protein
MVGLGVDVGAYRLRPRRVIVQDMHGPFAEGESCWPNPYRFAIDSPSQRAALEQPVEGRVQAIWSHGQLVRVASEDVLKKLRKTWGERRTEGARVEPNMAVPNISSQDRDLMRSFCGRGWLRLLVRAFEHVGCKAQHLGLMDPGHLHKHGAVGRAVLEGRSRHRLAVLEELLREEEGDEKRLFGQLDQLDQALDKAGGGTSWTSRNVPGHVRSLWPMRNLLRVADRVGVCFEEKEWKLYEDANTYAPELRILAVEPGIYGAGVEHDITHYLETIFWSSDRVAFEVANNGSEGDGQAMNNLILGCWYTGPGYEGYAGWPGAQLFEWLERAFQVASIPQAFCALRTFTIVLHREFQGDPRTVLKELVPGLVDGSHLDDLLRFYPGYVQHDHDFLGRMHPRYLTPVFAEWRDLFGEWMTESLEEHVSRCDSMLWSLEDIDLKSFDYELLGRSTNRRERNRIVGKKLVELSHLLTLAKEDGAGLLQEARRLLERVLATERGFIDPIEELGQLVATSFPEECSVRMGSLETSLGMLGLAVAKYEGALRELVERVAKAQRHWDDPVVVLTDTFMKPDNELFRGFYYEAAIHIGSDSHPGPKRLGEYESVV